MTPRQGAAGRDEPMPAGLRAATARALQEQFPGVRVWYGEATGSWWAMVPLREGPRLLEAPSSQQLREEIMSFRSRG
ncbi:hypothetical protein BKA00_000236 [Actinomadura coerulea]|uniref:Uncharacterized protein n=1 Tax=Actinomadura coerulea TaxID=46159 RepID=A0A7X0FUB1_9ACTN|nr:hypothetical protein [Actinomadura coerulea]MBB6393322.1 hypothetical protein [Actinomadura coerulea]GGQ37868.1 hypothetical protein GCM10010187_64630 [Actinomadura coerulea]